MIGSGIRAALSLLISIIKYLIRYGDAGISIPEPFNRKELEVSIRAATPVLQKFGFLDLFTPEEWPSGGEKNRALLTRGSIISFQY